MRAIWAGALLVCYLAVTGTLLLAGRDRVSGVGILVHFALLAAIVAATWWQRAPTWLRQWSPMLALLLLYSEMPMLIRAVGHDGFFDARVMAWEQALFGGQPARAWAIQMPWRPVSEMLHGAYLSYYAIVFSVPVLLWLRRRIAEFHDAVFVLMLAFVTCFACYLLLPVAGPRYVWSESHGMAPGPLRAFTLWLLEARSSKGTAFPSSHVAVAVTQSILAVRYFGARGWWLAGLTTALAAGAIYGGFHYAVDVIAGALAGGAVAVIGMRLTRRAHANATAPT
ncbi:MAG: phosphatase PAP2 family protein [Gemmatimonadaceae bacterium]